MTGTINVLYPQTLVVTVTSPFVEYYFSDSSGQEWTSFSDGSLQRGTFVQLQDEKQPKILDHTLGTGSTFITKEKRDFLQSVLSIARERGGEITILSDQEIHLIWQSVDIVFSLDNFQDQLRSLQVILTSPTIERKNMRIDVRFAHPVLRYL